MTVTEPPPQFPPARETEPGLPIALFWVWVAFMVILVVAAAVTT